LTPGGTETKPVPGTYLWEPADKPIAVRLSLDVVDRMQQDVMRGFGAVPKRGAEVGGILLGKAVSGDKTVVTIDDFVLVPIEYKRSPSYLLSEEDARAFDAAVDRTRNSPDPLLHPVGYFRSHTRDGVGLGPEDIAIFKLHFPEPEAVALIIRPYGTKVSQAGFYFKENGKFQSGTPLLEFPFRRRDLDPEASVPPRPVRPPDRSPPPRSMPRERTEHRPLGFDATAESWTVPGSARQSAISDPEAALAAELLLESKRKGRGGWVWVPLSFIFLLLGVLLGFQAALSMRPQLPPGSNEPYNLNVSVTKSGNNLQVKWDRQALAVRTAQKGLLTIEDGTYSKPVPLNAFDLQSGSVVYPPYSNHVRFRLDVMVNARDTVSETVDWRQ
jgi:hypothetical protein